MNIMKDDLYPLLFEPAYKRVFWGGSKLRTMLNRPLAENERIGESWEICDRPNISNPVYNGPLEGTTLGTLVEHFGAEFVGKNYKGGAFPLMVKLIDARERLSLQVHPTDEFCRTRNTYCEPKAEMWYVMQADPGARIYANLNMASSPENFKNVVHESDVENHLQQFDAVVGDAYFIPPGRVHFLGAGCFVLEISQNSTTSFRLTDWNRVDENGAKRELNLRDAYSCIQFTDRTNPRICGASNHADHNRQYPLINRCPAFRCNELLLVNEMLDSTDRDNSCHILTAVNLPFEVGNSKVVTQVVPGSSVLIPACFGDYCIDVVSGKETSIIRTSLL